MSNNKKNMKKTSKKPVKKMVKAPKPVKKILEYYYMTDREVTAKELSKLITVVDEEQVEIWPEINLMEVILTSDSLIFEDAKECFIDPLDLEFLEEKKILSIYQVSFEQGDTKKVVEIFKELFEKAGGFLASDSEDFSPFYTLENIEEL
ncbi:hypothetical protein P261_01443 [Lachnospiraceae bacterium TWA4]|nr:hypothetical protein P261_01443 [Lachnospiraceae bacterium TWA4]